MSHLVVPAERKSPGFQRRRRIGRVVIETATSLRSAREARHSARIICRHEHRLGGPAIRSAGPGGFADDLVPPLSKNATQKQLVATQPCVILSQKKLPRGNGWPWAAAMPGIDPPLHNSEPQPRTRWPSGVVCMGGSAPNDASRAHSRWVPRSRWKGSRGLPVQSEVPSGHRRRLNYTSRALSRAGASCSLESA